MISSFFKASFVAALLGTAALTSAQAAAIPYGNAGTENTASYTFSATSTGNIIAYFYSQSGASFSESLGLLVNGVAQGGTGLNNQTSSQGDSYDFGSVKAGDLLTFFIDVSTGGGTNYTLYSDPSRNPGGTQQVYSTSFAGNSTVPAGTYVGFEDLNPTINGSSNFNYQDEEFVFTNTTALSSVPLPASAPMFGAALLALAGFGYGMNRWVAPKGKKAAAA